MIDGDTLDVGGVRIRLHGIDAPESKQYCRAGGKRWSCGRDATRRGRLPVASADGPLHVPGTRSGPLRPGRGGVQPLGDRSQRVDGRARLGLRLPAVFACVRCRGVWSTGSETGQCGAATSCHHGIGAGASASPGRGRQLSRTAGGAASRATLARTARASTTCRAGGTTSRLESIRRRGAVVLHRGRGTGGRMAALKAVARVPAA